jgi:C-5 cytosine-specific DNA methylase
MKVLELFAGSRSIGKAAEELGMEVFSSDLLPFDGIHYACDIREFDLSKLPFQPDIVWASPPCTAFSVASIGRHWKGSTKGNYAPYTDTARLGLELLDATLKIIEEINPKFFFIENPRGLMRKMPQLEHLKRDTVTYCQYGDTRMKPTDIWNNAELYQPKPHCNNGDPCHTPAPRGSQTGTQGLKGAYNRSKIPHEFCLEVMNFCKNNQ